MHLRALSVSVLLTVAACLAAPQEAPVPVVVDIHGHSDDQHNATRYDADSSSDKGKDSPATSEESPIVHIPSLGSVRGSTSTSMRNKRPIYEFKGIHFAQPPLAEKRFKAPEPVAAWADDGVLDATVPGKACIQVSNPPVENARMKRAVDAQDQSEDCLLLNVYSPRLNDSKKLPVLVFVHGGSFTSGSVRSADPSALLDHDIVLVTPQYRLGPLGYFNLMEEDVPGNAGLLDLVEALRWVNRHIEHFGGDPGRVTLGGHSAGAASVALLYLSPLTKGLIHAVMPMSGSALSFWAWDRNPKPDVERIVDVMGCGGGDATDRVACLQTKPVADIMHAFSKVANQLFMDGKSAGMSGSSPSLQTTSLRVLEGLPADILRTKSFTPLPLLTGVTKHEGTFVNMLLLQGFLRPRNLTQNAEFLRYDLAKVLTQLIGTNDSAGFSAETAVARFLDPDTLGDLKAMTAGLIDFSGAFAFKTPAREMALLASRAEKRTYLYVFNYYAKHTLTPLGIYHGADQKFLFPSGARFNPSDESVAKTFVQFVANFVINHDPNPPSGSELGLPIWEPFAYNTEHYLEVDNPMKMKQYFPQELVAARSENFGANFGTATTGKTTDLRTAVPDDSTPGGGSRLSSHLWLYVSSLCTLLMTRLVLV